ncbi:MAG: hypothetical protein AABW54_04320 [Candidatus Micrarchaeota archaeon]
MAKTAFAVVALVAIAASFAAGLSGSQVTGSIVGGSGGYLAQGEYVALLTDQPLEVAGERYWVAYSYLPATPSTRNLLIAVNDNTGSVEVGEEPLEKVFRLVSAIDAVMYLEKNKLSPNDLKAFLESQQEQFLGATDNNYRTLVKNQLETKYPALDFSPVEGALEELKAEHAETNDQVLALFEARQLAFSYYAEQDMGAYVDVYNETLEKFGSLAATYRKYRAALRTKVDELANSAELNFSDKENIKTALEKLGGNPEYQSFYSSAVQPGAQVFQSVLDRGMKNAKNEVASTLYVIAKKEAEKAYTNELQSKMASLTDSKRERSLAACGIEMQQLREDWGGVRSVMENPSNSTREAYLAIPERLSKIALDAAGVEQREDDCINAPAAETGSKPDYSLVVNVLVFAAIAIGAYVLYAKYKKMRETPE